MKAASRKRGNWITENDPHWFFSSSWAPQQKLHSEWTSLRMNIRYKKQRGNNTMRQTTIYNKNKNNNEDIPFSIKELNNTSGRDNECQYHIIPVSNSRGKPHYKLQMTVYITFLTFSFFSFLWGSTPCSITIPLFHVNGEVTAAKRFPAVPLCKWSYWCAFSNVIELNSFPHTEHRGFSPVWVRLWRVRLCLILNDLLQNSQWNGFSPVWILIWSFKECFCLNLRLHCVHWKGRSPVWTRSCCFRLVFRANFFPQYLHFNAFGVCTIEWILRLLWCLNFLGHSLHSNFLSDDIDGGASTNDLAVGRFTCLRLV